MMSSFMNNRVTGRESREERGCERRGRKEREGTR